ncbi:MAG: MerR family transcriptional regulator [Bacteroidia bacterium]
MNFYQISDLERLTGIKAHTIRIWEKRYNLIEPHRTSTNIRYYDDNQARKLLNVSTLLAEGFKISKIAELSEKEINIHIQNRQNNIADDSICLAYINDLIAAMLVFDEPAFEKSFYSAVTRFGMYHAMIKVVYPFLHKTGLMWLSSDAMPVQEHFAANIIRRKLISAIDGLPASTKKTKTFLLFLPTEEWHETALLLSDYIIRSKGYKTIYLGQNVPFQNLDEVIKSTKSTHLFTFYIARKSPEEINKSLIDLSKNNKSRTIVVGGSFDFTSILKKTKNIQVLTSPDSLLKLL